MTLIDFHTHNTRATDAIISVDPANVEAFLAANNDAVISTGIHPWDTDCEPDLALLERVAAMPRVVAIGETGLDRLRGATLDRQIEIFRHHIELSERLGKPLIIHCVKAWDQLLAIRKEMKPQQNWGIHGYRGGPQQARQLLAQGLYLSLGQHFNPATAAIIPPDRLLAETDDTPLPISEISAKISTAITPTKWHPTIPLQNFLSEE